MGPTKAQDDVGIAVSSGVSIRAGSLLDVTPESKVPSTRTSPVKEATDDQEVLQLREELRVAMIKIGTMTAEAASFAGERAARILEFGVEHNTRLKLEEMWKLKDAEPQQHHYLDKREDVDFKEKDDE